MLFRVPVCGVIILISMFPEMYAVKSYQSMAKGDSVSSKPCSEGEYKKDGRCHDCKDCSYNGRKFKTMCGADSNAECGACAEDYHDIYGKQMGEPSDPVYPCQHCSVDTDNSTGCIPYRDKLKQAVPSAVTNTNLKTTDKTSTRNLPQSTPSTARTTNDQDQNNKIGPRYLIEMDQDYLAEMDRRHITALLIGGAMLLTLIIILSIAAAICIRIKGKKRQPRTCQTEEQHDCLMHSDGPDVPEHTGFRHCCQANVGTGDKIKARGGFSENRDDYSTLNTTEEKQYFINDSDRSVEDGGPPSYEGHGPKLVKHHRLTIYGEDCRRTMNGACVTKDGAARKPGCGQNGRYKL